MRELSLFTGMGGGIYGSLILGWETIAYVEKEEYCQKVIKQRQLDGWFDKGEIYGDIADFNKHHAKKYTGKIDVITGGFPCQPFSVAGKRKGTSDDRWLFDEIIKTIKIIQPGRLLFENVPGILTSNAIIKIYESLTKAGYRCKAPLVLGSADCGNIHKRERVWIFADSEEFGSRGREREECDDEWAICQQIEQERGALRCEASGCTVREIYDADTTSQYSNGTEFKPAQHQEQQEQESGNSSIELPVTHSAVSGCHNGQNHREKRQICEAEIGELSEIQPERSQCISGVDENIDVYDTYCPINGKQGCGAKTIPREQRLSRRESIGSLEDIIQRPDIPEPLFRRVDDELPDWSKQLKAIGNGQDPIVMATAWNLLSN